eukprot:scaffold1616_cov310-Pinguiococcus_pyrenoidosus.AAC.21
MSWLSSSALCCSRPLWPALWDSAQVRSPPDAFSAASPANPLAHLRFWRRFSPEEGGECEVGASQGRGGHGPGRDCRAGLGVRGAVRRVLGSSAGHLRARGLPHRAVHPVGDAQGWRPVRRWRGLSSCGTGGNAKQPGPLRKRTQVQRYKNQLAFLLSFLLVVEAVCAFLPFIVSSRRSGLLSGEGRQRENASSEVRTALRKKRKKTKKTMKIREAQVPCQAYTLPRRWTTRTRGAR